MHSFPERPENFLERERGRVFVWIRNRTQTHRLSQILQNSQGKDSGKEVESVGSAYSTHPRIDRKGHQSTPVSLPFGSLESRGGGGNESFKGTRDQVGQPTVMLEHLV